MHPIDRQLELMLHGEFDKGWEISEELEAMGPDGIPDASGEPNPEMWIRHCFNRGWFMLQRGDFQEGMQLLDAGRFINVYGSPPFKSPNPIWTGEDPTGKTIIISLEGGYGDEIIHARFATTLAEKGATVIIAADPQLHSLFYRIKGVSKCVTRSDGFTVEHDFWIPGFSVSWVAGIDYTNLPGDPYLTPNAASLEMWGSIITAPAGKVKVGIRWAGNPKFEHQQFRKFPSKFLIDIAKYDELQVFSLQRDDNIVELPSNIVDLQHLLISWEDTAAAISNLDIVITSCTSIAHLSAALGKETWVIVPILPYHTWTLNANTSDTSPWYKCVKLFRQGEFRSWSDTFNRLYQAIETKYNTSTTLPRLEKNSIGGALLNMGCGFRKIDGAVNVDNHPMTNPDRIVDLEQFPYPFDDNEFDGIVAKDILEHLGNTPKDFINVLKEMYRISKDQAKWTVTIPHWRCDNAINDPTHIRLLTIQTFKMFDQVENQKAIDAQLADSALGLYNDIDIEVVEVQFDFIDFWTQQLESGALTRQELDLKLNTINNVAASVTMAIKVHKPGRITKT